MRLMKPCVTPTRSTLHGSAENGDRFQLANTCDCICSCAHSTVFNHLERNPYLVNKEHLLLSFLMCLLKLVILIAAIGRFHACVVLLHASAQNRPCRSSPLQSLIYLGIPQPDRILTRCGTPFCFFILTSRRTAR